jgi:hypothetical protein
MGGGGSSMENMILRVSGYPLPTLGYLGVQIGQMYEGLFFGANFSECVQTYFLGKL